MGGSGERRIGQRRHTGRVGVDQRLLALVPGREQLGIGQATDQARVDQAGEAHPGYVPALGEHALEVPDGFLRVGKVVGEKAAAVALREEAVEAPQRILLGADVQQLDHQQVARLGALYTHRTGEVVHGGKVDIAHVAGVVVILDRAARPVVGLEDEIVARLDPAGHGNVRMPAVVDLLVFGGGLVQIDLDQGVGHDEAPGTVEGSALR